MSLTAMSPPPASNSIIATLSTRNASMTSPASLLWIHHLRREQNALASRLTDIEATASKSYSTCEERLDILTGHLNTLKSQIQEIKREIAQQAETIAEKKLWEEKWEKKVDEIRNQLRREFEESTSVTAEAIRCEIVDLRKEMAVDLQTGAKRRNVSTGTDNAVVGRSISSSVARHSLVGQVAEPMPVTTVHAPGNTMASSPTSLEASLRAYSIHIPAAEPEPYIQPLEKPTAAMRNPVSTEPISRPTREDKENQLLATLTQSTLSLQSYLELGKHVLSHFPHRSDENRVVEAFWKGLNDTTVQRIVAEKLEKGGWSWTVISDVILSLDMQQRFNRHNTRGRDDDPPNRGRREKRRRVIPVVWPTEEDEEDVQFSHGAFGKTFM